MFGQESAALVGRPAARNDRAALTGTAADGIATAVIRTLALSLVQLGDRRILAVLLRSLAVRHIPRGELPDWRRATASRPFPFGPGNAALFLVPGANLLAPVLGAAMATHLFHRSQA